MKNAKKLDEMDLQELREFGVECGIDGAEKMQTRTLLKVLSEHALPLDTGGAVPDAGGVAPDAGGAVPEENEVPNVGILERVSCPFCGQFDVERKRARKEAGIIGFRCRDCDKAFTRQAVDVRA